MLQYGIVLGALHANSAMHGTCYACTTCMWLVSPINVIPAFGSKLSVLVPNLNLISCGPVLQPWFHSPVLVPPFGLGSSTFVLVPYFCLGAALQFPLGLLHCRGAILTPLMLSASGLVWQRGLGSRSPLEYRVGGGFLDLVRPCWVHILMRWILLLGFMLVDFLLVSGGVGFTLAQMITPVFLGWLPRGMCNFLVTCSCNLHCALS